MFYWLSTHARYEVAMSYVQTLWTRSKLFDQDTQIHVYDKN